MLLKNKINEAVTTQHELNNRINVVIIIIITIIVSSNFLRSLLFYIAVYHKSTSLCIGAIYGCLAYSEY